MNLNKEITFGNKVREKMQEGADELANAVKATLGPKGRYVVIERGQGYPKSTKDGVSVAKEIFFADSYKNLGAQMIKQVAVKSADEAGDGTTTATVLAQAMLDEGNKAVASGINPVFIKYGMESACQEIVDKLKFCSKMVTSNEELENIATISANNDREIGSLIAKGMAEIGDYGVITVGESNNGKTELQIVPGMTFDQGLISPYLINDYTKMCCTFNECFLLLVDGKINDFNAVAPYIQHCSDNHKPLVIIAEDFSNNVLADIIYYATPDVRQKRMGIDLAAVKAPGFGNRRLQNLEDIAALTGAEVITKDKGLILGETSLDVFGKVEKIVIKQFETSLFGGYGEEEKVKERISYIQGLMDNTISDYDKTQYKERLAKLTGGMAVINVGGNSELEIKEKKDRLDDAIAAAKSAKEEGIVPGGGSTLYTIAQELDCDEEIEGDSRAFSLGKSIVKNACEAPIRNILLNAGFSNVEKILIKINKDYLYNARDEVYEDVASSKIIDPAKVVRCALQNAVSVVGVMLTTSAAIVTDNKNTAEKSDTSGVRQS